MTRLVANLKNEEFFLRLIRDKKLKVTKDGRAFNLVTGHEIATGVSGYRKLSWLDTTSRKIKQIQLHRLVWATFKRVEPREIQINHKDGNKSNCSLDNLEAVTATGNITHAHRTGLVYVPLGGDRSNAVFSDEDVVRLRKEFSALAKLSLSGAAKQLEVHPQTLAFMLKGKTYSHIKTGLEEKCAAKILENRKYQKTSTTTKRKIVSLKRQNKSSYQIAEELHISRNTVMKHW